MNIYNLTQNGSKSQSHTYFCEARVQSNEATQIKIIVKVNFCQNEHCKNIIKHLTKTISLTEGVFLVKFDQTWAQRTWKDYKLTEEKNNLQTKTFQWNLSLFGNCRQKGGWRGDEGSRREGGGALVLARRVMAQILVTPNLDNNVLPRHQTQTDRGVILLTKQIPKIEKRTNTQV